MTPIDLERNEARSVSRRRFALAAITTLSVAGFGGAALSGVMSARPGALAKGSDDSGGSGGSGASGGQWWQRWQRWRGSYLPAALSRQRRHPPRMPAALQWRRQRGSGRASIWVTGTLPSLTGGCHHRMKSGLARCRPALHASSSAGSGCPSRRRGARSECDGAGNETRRRAEDRYGEPAAVGGGRVPVVGVGTAGTARRDCPDLAALSPDHARCLRL